MHVQQQIEDNLVVETEVLKTKESIENEFTQIRSWASNFLQNQSFYTATLEENKAKNRYKDVLPYEDTRVKLEVKNQQESDYINGNYIRLSSNEHHKAEYISCQAPVPATFYDFWRMVVEQKISIIVMLTNLIEGEKQKAHQYWPNHGEKKRFKNLIISSVSSNFFNSLAIRYFRIYVISPSNGKVIMKRDIYHLQFTEWDDMSVPASSFGIRQLTQLTNFCYHDILSKSKANHSTNSSGNSSDAAELNPIVVHCSAGIGRAGTFIAIHQAINQLFIGLSNDLSPKDIVNSINIPTIVQILRSQRMGMVQTYDQYYFIYQTLFEQLKQSLFSKSLQNSSVSERSTPPSPL